ncbi:hypothetical protein [Neisseria sicca]|uniref:hypothetical protein n=1 Tax=Neisseria sicca TaxID=490 RepID=UPI0011BCFC17|nr:hypothetical protein [Neisseria sicca]
MQVKQKSNGLSVAFLSRSSESSRVDGFLNLTVYSDLHRNLMPSFPCRRESRDLTSWQLCKSF